MSYEVLVERIEAIERSGTFYKSVTPVENLVASTTDVLNLMHRCIRQDSYPGNIEFIFDLVEASILVHLAGYGHIEESKKMAKKYAELLEHPPLPLSARSYVPDLGFSVRPNQSIKSS